MKPIITIYCKVLLLLVVFTSCSSDREQRRYEKTPLDKIITTYLNEPNYSVILADMDYNEAEKAYYHKYRILIEKPQKTVDSIKLNDNTTKAEDVVVEDTDWKRVSPTFFDKHVDDLGMTILSKKDGILDKKATPAGYDRYVGNERYGRWQTHSNGSSFWVFYGQYRFLSDLFYGPSYRYYRNDYRDYDRNYRGKKAYYGSGKNKYGTSSTTARTASSSKWNSKSSSFKQRVRSNVKKSAAASSSRKYSSGSRYSKTKRNSSRYSRSSSRSRGGGFGK